MELPEDVVRHIKEYCKPITRPDWRKGGSFKSELFECGLFNKFFNTNKILYIRAMFSLSI